MKSIKEIEATRLSYHAESQANTVHRSSLLAPSLARQLPSTRVDVSFSNHFLLKRGYDDVACRLTGVGRDGRAVVSSTHAVTEPRVYTFELSEMTNELVENYIVEFFSARNLFIPFPAVIINHRSGAHLNSVHSYNRVLNDVFEDEAVNATRVREASIDLLVDEGTDTFVLFTAGPERCRGPLLLEVDMPGQALSRELLVDVPRLCNEWISLRQVFGDDLVGARGVLTVRQPDQSMFYGRLLAGLHSTGDDAFAANHSFYDCSDLPEYCEDGSPSARVYPLLEGFDASVRLYPIFSPCELRSAVDVYDMQGRLVREIQCESLRSPSAEYLEVPVSALLAAGSLETASAFRFRVWPAKGCTPRRINHQIVYSDPQKRSPLAASVAISLRNPNHLQPRGREGLIWGQCALHADLITRVGLVLDDAERRGSERVELTLLSEKGEVHRETFSLQGGASHGFDPAELVPELVPTGEARPHYLWYWARSARSDLSGYSVTRHRRTGHCSGEHCF